MGRILPPPAHSSRSQPRGLVRWRGAAQLADARLEVVEGLERPTGRMLIKEGYPDTSIERPGLLRFTGMVAASRFEPLPRPVYGLRLLLSEAAPGLADDETIAALAAEAAQTRPWLGWVTPETLPSLRYRFSVEGRKPSSAELRHWLESVRRAFQPLGFTDNPSAYNCDVVASWRSPRPSLHFKPRFPSDRRFAYRERDVAAAINPVLAAALARLVPVPIEGAVIDPTCGSGTLLVERALVDPTAALVGIDIDASAMAAAKANVAAADLAARTELRRADARASEAWSPCGVVIANLPFGIRSGRRDPDLDGLYQGILARASEALTPSGRVLLATANRGGLERAIAASPAFRVLARHRVLSGGLYVHVTVLGRRGV